MSSPCRRIVFLALALTLAAGPISPTCAQVILNVERLQAGDREGAYGALTASGSFSAGNTDVVQLGGAVGTGFRGERHWPRLFAGGEILRSGSGRIVDNRFVHARYGYLFTPRIRSFHFVQLQSNRNLLVERRWLVGSGVRLAFPVSEGLTLEAGTGPMLEDETLNADRLPPGASDHARVVRLASLAVVRWRIGDDLELLNVVYHQPVVDDLGDFRLLDDLTLAVRVAEAASVDVTLEWRHDSRPPPDLDDDDVRLRVGFSVAWGGG